MKLPYEDATAGDKALATAQKILERFGCTSFGTMIDQERQCVIVAFKWRGRNVQLEASWKGYATAWLKAHPLDRARTWDRQKHDRRARVRGEAVRVGAAADRLPDHARRPPLDSGPQILPARK